MISEFDLLKGLFGRLYIPEAVYQEVVVKGKERAGSEETKNGIANRWIERVSVRDRLAVMGMLSNLDEGEAESIILANELGADYILLDEEKGREIANSMGLNIIGTIGILSLAKKRGLLRNLRAKLDELKANDFRISKGLYEEIIREGEKGE
jgi:hypothetical protein